MTSFDVIKKLCEDEGITISSLEKELGYGNGSLSKAKKIPAERIREIAKRFNCSMEYLMTGDDEKGKYYLNDETASIAQSIFENDKVLFDVYRSSDKNRLIEYAKRLKALRDMEENGGE